MTIENPRVRGSIPRLPPPNSTKKPILRSGLFAVWRSLCAGVAWESPNIRCWFYLPSPSLPYFGDSAGLHLRAQPSGFCGVVGALCLCGIGRGVVLRGQTTTYPWRGCPVGVRGLYDQGRRGAIVAEEGVRVSRSLEWTSYYVAFVGLTEDHLR